MTNIDRAADVLHAARADRITLSPEASARALADAGLLIPEPQVIRTRDELEALDPDTLVSNFSDFLGDLAEMKGGGESVPTWVDIYLPAVVIATGDQVRAARQALDGIE